jgi:hypothetical protein
MRTLLQLFKMAEPTGASSSSTTPPVSFCNMFDYLGSVVHNANASAAKGILCVGLRNDFANEGVPGGRTAVMANPFGPEDECVNKNCQRDTGEVHVGIDIDWWEWCGRHATDTTGVRAFVAGPGSIVFSNVNSGRPTIISARCFYKVMTRYNVTDLFARATRDDPSGAGSSVPGYSMNWYHIWQPELIDHCDPPLDHEVDGVLCYYSLLPTLEEIPTPHMGLEPTTDATGSLHCLASWILD